MSSFEDRKKSFEKKFAHDEELQFKVSARRNKYLGQWASQILGYNSDQEAEYIQFFFYHHNQGSEMPTLLYIYFF